MSEDALILVPGRDPLASEIGWTGGHDIYVRAHARAAMRAGFSPRLFCLADREGVSPTPLGPLHRVRRRAWPYKLWTAPLHVGVLARAIERFVLARRITGVLLHGFGPWGAASVLAARRLSRRETRAVAVVGAYATYRFEAQAKIEGLDTSHGWWERLQYRLLGVVARHLVDPLERRACRDAATVLVNYRSVARLVRDSYGGAIRCRQVPYASEAAFLPPEDEIPLVPAPAGLSGLAPADAPMVLAVGRHDPRKGMDVLLRALARLRRAGIPFRACLVGGGPLLSASRLLAAQLDLAGQVAVEGFVRDPADYRRHADLFVLPSRREGSGSLALIEALGAGLPVVASACDGIPEDVEDGRSALLVPPGDVGALADAMARLLADPRLRATLAVEARRVHAERFSAEAFTRALRGVYGELGFEPRGREVRAGEPGAAAT